MVLTGMQGMRRAVFDGQSAKNKAANEVVRGGARLGQIATWKPKRHHLLTRHDDGFGGYCDSHLASHLRPDLQASLSLCQARKGQHHSEVVPSGYLPRSKETSSGATFDLTGATTRLDPRNMVSRLTPLRWSDADPSQPTAADIRRKNANFAARAQAGKKTARPARSTQRRSVGTWVLLGMGFLLVGGSESLFALGTIRPLCWIWTRR